MNTIADETAIRMLKAIAQNRLGPSASEPIPDSNLGLALAEVFSPSSQQPASEGGLARAALALLSEDPNFAEPIRLMSNQATNPYGAQRYVEPATIALTTAVLLALQTRIKIKADQSGKWSIEIDKKSAGDAAVKLVVQRLLPFLSK